IASHDKMGATVILANDRVKNRLARARVSHRRRIHRKHRPSSREIMLEHGFVALHPNLGRYVIRFCLAHKRMQQQPVYCFERALDDVLMSPVNRVASLKSDDPPPAFVLERVASLTRVQPILSKGG